MANGTRNNVDSFNEFLVECVNNVSTALERNCENGNVNCVFMFIYPVRCKSINVYQLQLFIILTWWWLVERKSMIFTTHLIPRFTSSKFDCSVCFCVYILIQFLFLRNNILPWFSRRLLFDIFIIYLCGLEVSHNLICHVLVYCCTTYNYFYIIVY